LKEFNPHEKLKELFRIIFQLNNNKQAALFMRQKIDFDLDEIISKIKVKIE
jgi:hypothetical protein